MKGLNKIALVVSKILEILYWMATAVMAAVFVGSIAARSWMAGILSQTEFGATLTTGEFEIVAVNANGTVNMAAVTFFALCAVILLGLMAMVFRNIYLIMRTMTAGTRFAAGNTPFQKDIVRMVREIGIFCISGPAVALIMSVIARAVIGAETVEMSVDIQGFIIGIVVLCLSQVFAYGTQLQNDVDGLV